MRILLTAAFAGLILLSGCAKNNQALYNYGTYSTSYYAYEQDMGPEKTLELQKAIEEAIANAHDSQSGRVPPGMYANLGYIYLKQGDSTKAVENFTQEKTLYPESARFMDSMLKKIETAEEGKVQ